MCLYIPPANITVIFARGKCVVGSSHAGNLFVELVAQSAKAVISRRENERLGGGLQTARQLPSGRTIIRLRKGGQG